jgi:hypothetical protein
MGMMLTLLVLGLMSLPLLFAPMKCRNCRRRTYVMSVECRNCGRNPRELPPERRREAPERLPASHGA